MKKNIKKFGLLAIIILLTISCDQNQSLQKYYIDSSENTNFISLDIPASVLSLKNESVTSEIKETLKSIRKVNFLGYELKNDNQAEFKIEKQKISAILKNPKYQDLFSIGGKQSIKIKFLGEEDAIDEIIVFGSDNKKGFALMRLIGKNMDPSKMMALTKELNFDGDDGTMKQLAVFMKNLN